MNMYGHEASHLVAALAIAVPVGCLFVTPKPAAGDGFSGGVTATGKTKHAEALLCFVGCVYERATNGTMKRAFNDAQDGVLAAGGLKKELLLDADAFVQHFDGVIKMAAIGAYHLADKSGNTGGAELARLTDWLRPHIRDELPQWVVGREDRWRVAVGSGALCSICN
jgi:hypothetical protein